MQGKLIFAKAIKRLLLTCVQLSVRRRWPVSAGLFLNIENMTVLSDYGITGHGE